MKRKDNVNDSYFEIIDSDLKAYLLGFFIADGCIQMNARCKNSYKLSVNISECDRELIELYQKKICPNNKISLAYYKKGAADRKPTCMITWTSNKMKEDLDTFNIIQKKTNHFNFEFPFNKIPKELIFSFIRGFFDGDGHLSYSKENNTQFTFAFYGTSKIFLQQLGEIFEKEFTVKAIIDESQKKNIILYCLRFNSFQKRKEFIKKLYNKMYVNSEFSLQRKRNKFESYLNTVLNLENKTSKSV